MKKFKIEASCDFMTLQFRTDAETIEEALEYLEDGLIDIEDMEIIHLGDVTVDPDTVQESDV
jgi:hypothetical protein